MNLLRPISISLSPNTEKDDVQLAFRLKFQPWRWKNGKEIEKLEEEFKKYLGTRNAISFNSGRSSLMAILNSLGLEKGTEILLQSFTCNAVPNPAIWSGFKPVYVDIKNDTFNIDSEDLREKITPKSRVVIVQHTFGLPADMDEIVNICNENNLILIEDCAHSLGAEYKGKKVGTMGRVSFFSFSRDKVISSVYGGIVSTNDDDLAKKIREYQEKAGYPSCFWIFQQILHPILTNWVILPTYKLFGKYLLVLFQWIHILSKAVHWREKRGLIPGYFPKRLPNALAILALNQFRKLEKLNTHRQEISKIYYNGLLDTNLVLPVSPEDRKQNFLRFAVKSSRAHEIIKKAWRDNLLIGDWYTTAIAPHDTKLEKMYYIQSSCPVSEKLAKTTLNLPTHINISKEDAGRIVNFIKSNAS